MITYVLAEMGLNMKRILIIGGDKRQLALSDMLKEKGHSVGLQGFQKLGFADEDMAAPDYVFLPVPYRNPDGSIKAPYADAPLELTSIVRRYPGSVYVLGRCDDDARAVMDGHVRYLDFNDDEAFLIRNALLTAQAAICAYAKYAETALCDTKCLVVGYGRISKFLCRLLKAHGAKVAAAARKSRDLELIGNEGLCVVRIDDLAQSLPWADVIFNTVPAHIFTENELLAIRRDAAFIELASPPYGMDLKLAEKCMVNVRIEPSLPGLYFPASAARAMLHSFEREELKQWN